MQQNKKDFFLSIFWTVPISLKWKTVENLEFFLSKLLKHFNFESSVFYSNLKPIRAYM